MFIKSENASVARGELSLQTLRFLNMVETGGEGDDPESSDFDRSLRKRVLTSGEKRLRDAAVSCLTELFNSPTADLDVAPRTTPPPAGAAGVPVVA